MVTLDLGKNNIVARANSLIAHFKTNYDFNQFNQKETAISIVYLTLLTLGDSTSEDVNDEDWDQLFISLADQLITPRVKAWDKDSFNDTKTDEYRQLLGVVRKQLYSRTPTKIPSTEEAAQVIKDIRTNGNPHSRQWQ